MEEKKVYELIFSFTLTIFLFLIFDFVFLILGLGIYNIAHELWWK